MPDAAFIAAILAGLTGSLHCVAMCGGFATASVAPVAPLLPARALARQRVAMQAGRLVTYALLGAALAYLEVLWIEACSRARETESARVELDALGADGDQSLHDKAQRYHAAVRRLRDSIELRVAELLVLPNDTIALTPLHEQAGRDRRRAGF